MQWACTILSGTCSTALADEKAAMDPNAVRPAKLAGERVELARERAASMRSVTSIAVALPPPRTMASPSTSTSVPGLAPAMSVS